LHAVSVIRETDDCSRDAGRDEPEDRAANHRDAPTIAAFHAENRSSLAAPLPPSNTGNEWRFATDGWVIGRPTPRGSPTWAIFADQVVAAAILDRLLHHATVVNIKGKSYRMRRLKGSETIVPIP
jgi:hypothetical protein